MSHLSMIVAMDENRLIGSNNELPWHLPADLAFFKRTTMGKPIVMGRKTFESIGRPLPGRLNIVISRNPGFTAEGCEVAGDIDTALAICNAHDEVMLIGGASLYQQAIDQATIMYLTRIHHSFTGDTWFPEYNEDDWTQVDRQDLAADSKNPYSCSFVKYVREI